MAWKTASQSAERLLNYCLRDRVVYDPFFIGACFCLYHDCGTTVTDSNGGWHYDSFEWPILEQREIGRVFQYRQVVDFKSKGRSEEKTRCTEYSTRNYLSTWSHEW